jgi:signal transduction histidine kinase
MGPSRLARITTASYAPALGAGLLGLAAVGQTIAWGAAHSDGATLTVVFLGPFALAATLPLLFLRPVAAAATIAVANVLTIAAAGEPTVAGAVAQVIAVYHLFVPGGFGGVAPPVGHRLGGARGPADGAPRAGPQLLAACVAVTFLGLALTDRGSVGAVLLASFVPVAAGAGIAVRARGEAAVRTADREVLAGAITEHLARGERARIARELHDVVAHHISMIAVQAETARLTTAGLPAAGAQRLTEIGDTARAGLTEMRRLLGVLREDADVPVADRHPQPGLPQLTELIDKAREASGTGVRLIVSGPVAVFDPGVELAAFRIVQEALTNARRHAPGAAVDVELRYADDGLWLRIRDNGPGPGPGTGTGQSSAGGGHGLLGMRERAATVGGSLRTGAAPGGGFLIEADLPAKPEVT